MVSGFAVLNVNFMHNVLVNTTRVLNYVFDYFSTLYMKELINPLSANPTKRSNTIKQFSQRIVSMCLTILWDWRLKI